MRALRLFNVVITLGVMCARQAESDDYSWVKDPTANVADRLIPQCIR